jgi:parallel beta-helix repeat protein
MEKKTASAIMLTLLLISMLTLAFNIQLVKAEPRTWIVDDDGPADFRTIREAINAANPGDTIFVYNGTYYESVVVNKTVSLIGENRNTTIIDGNKAARVVSVTANDVILENLTIQNSLPWYASSGCLYITSNSNIIQNNIITNNGENGMGIWLDSTVNNTVTNNDITENYFGITLIDSSNNTIANNNVTNNSGYGVYLSSSMCNVISSNTIVNNPWGVILDYSLSINMNNNTISESNYYGVALSGSSDSNLTNNVVNSSIYGIVLSTSKNLTLKNNNITNNQYCLGIHGWLLSEYLHDIDISNTVNGKPVYYWVNKQNEIVPSNAGYVGLINCTEITVQNLNLTSNWQGLLLAYSTRITVQNLNLTSNYWGLRLANTTNSLIRDVKFFKNDYGIELYRSREIMLQNSVITDNSAGLFVRYSENCTLVGNIMTNNTYSFGVHGPTLESYTHNIDSSNIINGKPICYWINKENLEMAADVGYIGLVNCTNISVKNITASNGNIEAILLAYTNSSRITNALIMNNVLGIKLWTSYNNIIENTRIINNQDGCIIWNSNNNTMTHNIIDNSSRIGLGLWDSTSNVVVANTIVNTFSTGYAAAMDLEYSNYNVIFHNNFVNNTVLQTSTGKQVDVLESFNNTWDDGYPSGGNYWSDYTGVDSFSGPYQNETGSDGIGDTLFTIHADNRDNYPLMGPWTIEGGNVTVTPSSDVAITFGNITSAGITTLNVSMTGPDPPSGFKLATETPTYYDIKTTANYTGAIQIRIAYNDASLTQDQENNLRLMHWNNTLQRWIDITKYVDTENNLIYGETSTFSTFAIMLSPNMAVKNITISKTIVGQGYSITINITVENQGGYTETFNVTLYANTTFIATQTVTLTSGNSTTISLVWNTTGFAKGNYTISAVADTVPGETDTADNTFVNGVVKVTIAGDMNGDGHVNILDAILLGNAFDSKPGEPAWSPNADINGDGYVNILDAIILGNHFDERES